MTLDDLLVRVEVLRALPNARLAVSIPDRPPHVVQKVTMERHDDGSATLWLVAEET